ncbi:unnamed protein product [Prorocentrum cordatum]|uniref:RNA-directed RNA polymerase n=1 Tax=Prorocentrum cordatum TaxID=2364126 RepID=A0ABN9S192_9DINO|nr:unnamed protein product [Polarella glacialis]
MGQGTFDAPTTAGAVSELRQYNGRLRGWRQQFPRGADDWEVVFWNEDLKGFFPSVPQDWLIADVESLLREFVDGRAGTLKDEKNLVFTVFPKDPKRKTVCGLVRDPDGVHIPVKFVIPVLRHAQEASVFLCAGEVVRQIRGAFIGSPLSPAWCTISVMQRERDWIRSALGRVLRCQDMWMALRYVDNRLVLGFRNRSGVVLVPSSLLDSELYLPPVALEKEPANDFVGVKIMTEGTTVETQYIVEGFDGIAKRGGVGSFPEQHRWRYRSSLSGGSQSVKVAGLLGRLHQAVRLSFPVPRAQKAAVQLVGVYVALGHRSEEVARAVSVIRKRYPQALGKVGESLARAARRGDLAEIVRLHDGL